MKNNVFKRFFTKKQKFAAVFFTVLILNLTFVALISIPASANVDIRVENYKNCDKYLQKLNEEASTYSAYDKDPNKAASSAVAQVIGEYRDELLALQSHPEIEERYLEAEILLSYSKGTALARLTWIYHYNSKLLNEASVGKVRKLYESCSATIDSATIHSTVTKESDELAAQLNSLVYAERAQNLALPTDSLSAKALISGASEELKQIKDPDISATKLESVYQRLIEDLSLQRTRDSLLNEIKEAFAYIRPAENISNSSDFALFAYNLEKSLSLSEMNSAALSCINAFIDHDPSKPYSSKIKTHYIESATTIANKATESSLPADFSGAFDSYPLAVKKSTTKDSIYALCFGDGYSTDEELQKIETEFNAINGRIDLCMSSAETDAEFTKAKAKLFLHKHSAIYEKSLESIVAEDETTAKNALVEYTELEAETKSALLSEINIIAEKYNLALRKKIAYLMPNDELYLKLCEYIINDLKAISRKEIDVFYNKSSRITEKAFALAEVIREYREILATEESKSFRSEESSELEQSIQDFSANIKKISLEDLGVYSDKVEDAKNQTIRRLVTAHQCAKVRIAARNSKNPAIAEEVSQGQSKIRLCTTKGEIITQANRAIFKINRLLTADEIANQINEAKKETANMQFLTSEEQTQFQESSELLSSFSNNAKTAENVASLEAIWQNFLSEKDLILSKAAAIDLSRATAAYIDKVAEEAQKAIYKLGSLEFIAKPKSDELYNLIDTDKANATKNIPLLKSTQEVLNCYANFLKSIENHLVSAETAELEGYKSHLLSKFDKYTQLSANYSDENYDKILQTIEEAEKELLGGTTKESCTKIIDSAILKISSINDLLADEKDKATASLDDALAKYKTESELYSAENLTAIETIYNEAILKISEITDIANITSVAELLTQYTLRMKEINKDCIYTSDEAMNNLALPSVRYPDSYDTANGLWGSITAHGSLVSDAELNLNMINASNVDDLTEKLREAAKKQTVISSAPLSKETLKLLSSAKIVTTLNVSLSKIHPAATNYSLNVLMPTQMLSENVIGFALVRNDGSVEFYPSERIDAILSANVNSLASLCVVAEGTINVSPLLIFLIFLLTAEFIILASILYIRMKKKNRGEDIVQNLPMAAFLPAGATMTRVLPENGLILAVFLSIAALALGLTIVLLVKNEAKEKKNNEPSLLNAPRRKELLSNKNPTPQLKASKEEEEKVFCTVGGKGENEKRYISAQIDLDTIADNFEAGETVNMETLKYKGLVSKDADYVKILAKGKLTKPLRVEANEFSTAARKILEMSGGEAKEIKK